MRVPRSSLLCFCAMPMPWLVCRCLCVFARGALCAVCARRPRVLFLFDDKALRVVVCEAQIVAREQLSVVVVVRFRLPPLGGRLM